MFRHVATDRTVFHRHSRPDVWTESSFSRVRGLRDAIHGKVEVYKFHRKGQDTVPCVVKVMENRKVHCNSGKETDERKADLHPNLLKMIGVFEDPFCTRLVTEECDGGELFDAISNGGPLREETAAHYLSQMLSAMQYLLSHRIGHRDISLENTLFRRGEVQIMDFGQAVESHSPEGAALRYFRPAGKEAYRAPEAYVPTRGPVVQAKVPELPAKGRPTAEEGATFLQIQTAYLCEVRLPEHAVADSMCDAELLGYTVAPVDVFALGVCMFMMCLGYAPWRKAALSDTRFGQFYRQGDFGVSGLVRQHTPDAWLLRSNGMDFLSRLLRPNPALRPTVGECLADPWIARTVEKYRLVGADGDAGSTATSDASDVTVSRAMSDGGAADAGAKEQGALDSGQAAATTLNGHCGADALACTVAVSASNRGGSNHGAEEVESLDDVETYDVMVSVNILEHRIATEDCSAADVVLSFDIVDVVAVPVARVVDDEVPANEVPSRVEELTEDQI